MENNKTKKEITVELVGAFGLSSKLVTIMAREIAFARMQNATSLVPEECIGVVNLAPRATKGPYM